MRVLITGAGGFVGSHLVGALDRHGPHEIHGLGRRAANLPGLRYHIADLLERDRVADLLREVRPDWVFHLAGHANVGASFREPSAAWEGNLTTTLRFYEAVERSGVSPRILFVSTGLVYGDVTRQERFDEDTPMAPPSPYAASKAAADLLSYSVTRHPGLDVVRVRPFNHVGPGQSADFAIPNFARQLAAIERGELPPVLETGDLSAYRDFTDVRDMVNAYVAVLEHGRTGEAYNAASGVSCRIADVLARLVEISGLDVDIRQRIDPGRQRDVAITRADVSKLKAATGWEPRRQLDETLRDVLDWWRANPRP